MTRYVYRDRKTGRFTKKSTWKRSRSLGGKRYVRSLLKPRSKRSRVPQPSKGGKSSPRNIEYVIEQTYQGKRRNRGEIRIHLFAPPGLDRETILDAIEKWSLEQESLPDRWAIRAIDWRRGEYKPADLKVMLAKMFSSGKLI